MIGLESHIEVGFFVSAGLYDRQRKKVHGLVICNKTSLNQRDDKNNMYECWDLYLYYPACYA